jgi:hypothetical protein
VHEWHLSYFFFLWELTIFFRVVYAMESDFVFSNFFLPSIKKYVFLAYFQEFFYYYFGWSIFFRCYKRFKNIMLFVDYIKFNLQYFDWYIFCFIFYFILILSFRVLFNLIFILTLVFTFFIIFFLILCLNWNFIIYQASFLFFLLLSRFEIIYEIRFFFIFHYLLNFLSIKFSLDSLDCYLFIWNNLCMKLDFFSFFIIFQPFYMSNLVPIILIVIFFIWNNLWK